MITNEKILELSKLLKSNCAEFQIIIDIFNKNENIEYKIKNVRNKTLTKNPLTCQKKIEQ